MIFNLSKTLIYLFYILLLVFLTLAAIAMWKYPGKTLDSDGFSLIWDYWCDLYRSETPAGNLNTGMLFAKLSTLAAAVSFSLFWLVIPGPFVTNKVLRIVTSICGTAAILCCLFLFSGFHNIAIIMGSMLGIVALLLLCYHLRISNKRLYYFGIAVITLVALCNIILYTPIVEYVLPWLQKLAFVLTLVWSILLSKDVLAAKV